VTALFSEDTGVHPPIDVEWSIDSSHGRIVDAPVAASPSSRTRADETVPPDILPATPPPPADPVPSQAPSFGSLWELAVAVNRADPAALAVVSNGASSSISVDGSEVRRLLGTVWFRTVVPRMSAEWRARILDAFVNGVTLPNHLVKIGRQAMPIGELTYAQLQQVSAASGLIAAVRPDLDLLLTIGRLWGDEAIRRIRFSDSSPVDHTSPLGGLLQGVRANSR
jgi:hypothetical protein